MKKITKMNKRGWLKIVEAFFAVLLIATAVIMIIDKEYAKKGDISEDVYDIEVKLLKEIIKEFGAEGIRGNEGDIYDFINGEGSYEVKRIPNYLECDIEVYYSSQGWFSGGGEIPYDKNVYIQTLPIIVENNPSKETSLRILCWIK